MNGIIIINKEKGYTSNDVVQIVKKIFKEKVGHTGTLDPMATGVLPLLIGKGTNLSKYLINHDKIYQATLTLGQKMDTGDVEGNVVEEKDVEPEMLDEIYVNDILKSFIGNQVQTPPIYSAIKVKGKKLYEYARNGQEVEIPTRNITIYNMKLIELNENVKQIKFEVHCSKGTYIRTLCKDIGEKLGCGATMSALKRVQAGKFTIDTAVTLEELLENKEKYLLDLEIPLNRFDIISLNDEDGRKYINGIRLCTERKDGLYRVYIGGRLYGVCRVNENVIRSEKRI